MLKSVIATNDNITLFLKDETIVINKIKNEQIFLEVLGRVEKADLKWIEKNLTKIKDAIEAKTNGIFSVETGVVMLKGTNIPVPEVIVKKLLELEKEQKPIMPLLRFWRKLSTNPSEDSRKDLFTFMTKNNIPITENGDIVVEKGVNQKSGSFPGDLVDAHTGRIDNSIGCYVEMPREKVNADRNQTCSTGLHVAAPEYVRDNYGSHVIIECLVNPKDVVSVPTDYNATKMRCCAYRVVGYAKKEKRKSLEVVKLSDFMTSLPTEEQIDLMGGAPKKAKVVKLTEEDAFDLNGMTAKAIVDLVKEKTGELITLSLKSKKSIVKRAEQILEVHSIKLVNNGK